jgi:hypothetical protein
MPVCNKCKKRSNCLTIDPCDHCGAKDWVQTTVLPSRASQRVDQTQGCGLVVAIVVIVAIGFGIYFFFVPDNQQLAFRYSIPEERVSAPPKPHGCAFSDAPLGDKHCHYDKHVYVYDKTRQVIEVDGNPQTCSAGCGPAYSVVQEFSRVED